MSGLSLVIVLLFTAWPKAFGAMMTALHIPLTAMLLGIVFRGTAFVFRKYDSRNDAVQRRWSQVFGITSAFTPLMQGTILGALATGTIRVGEDGIILTGFFAGWLTPFALSCGIFALVLFAFLAAVYLTLDSVQDSEVQNDFRVRAIISGMTLPPVATFVFFTSKAGAPEMFRGLTNWWAPLLLLWTSLLRHPPFLHCGDATMVSRALLLSGRSQRFLLGGALRNIRISFIRISRFQILPRPKSPCGSW